MGTKKKNPRVFLGLSEVSGLYLGLEEGFKQLDIPVTRIDLAKHPYKYSARKENLGVRLFQFSMQQLSSKRKVIRGFWKFISLLCKFLLFIRYLFTCDIFIFSYATSFFRLQDLKILKFLGKKIIFQFHGSDSRPPFMDGSLIYKYDVASVIKMTASKKQQLKIINRYADAIIDIPPMGLFHERPFVNWLHIGITISVTRPPETDFHNFKSPIKILHAPSNPLTKGSEIIEQTINKLKAQGYEIEFMQIRNQQNETVKKALAECDFVIDQLYADYPMPGFAAESAWYSKATVICGYAKELWTNLLPVECMPPTYYVHPEELEEAIKILCDNHALRIQLGSKAFEFVSQKWSPVEVAKRYMRVINNDIPKEWYCLPENISYTHGCGVSENYLRSYLKKFINEHGMPSLQLQDKPQLENNFKEFVRG